MNQQKDIRDAYRSFATTIAAYAQSTPGVEWPFVTLPFFESYAKHVLIQSGTEVFSVFPMIKHDQRESWVQYANETYVDMVNESHALETTDDIQELTPVGYHPYISAPDMAHGGFQPDKERDYYFASWHYSPPPFTYGLINWNVGSVPDYENILEALMSLKNETLVTRVRKYVGVGTALSQEEHDKMHSALPTGSDSEHPHSFVFHPIHEIVDDYNSPIVAVTASGMAWDFSLRNLVPDNVFGLQAIIKNDCNQSYTYEIDGTS